MMKKCILFIAVGFLLLIPFFANAAIIENGEFDNGVKWTLDDEGVLTFSGSGGISKGSWNTAKVKSAVIPEGITSIEYHTFKECWNMTRVSIPQSVQSIGEGAFYECEWLTQVTIPNGVTSIRDYTFNCCKKLKTVSIPNSVKSIGDSAFLSCENLTSITIPNGVTELGPLAFGDCEALKSVTIPGSIKRIGRNCFAVCPDLNKVIIKEGVEVLEEGAFWANCVKEVTIPNSVIHIGSNAFSEIEELSCQPNSYAEQWAYENSYVRSIVRNINVLVYKIDFRKGTAIVKGASNKNVTKVSIPASISACGKSVKIIEIAKNAFNGFAKLKKVTIGKNIKKIGQNAFYKCKKLKTITIQTKNLKKKNVGKNAFKGVHKKPTVKCPTGLAKSYKSILSKKGMPKAAKYK